MQKYHFSLLIVDTIALAKAKSCFLVRSVLIGVCATALDEGKLSEKVAVVGNITEILNIFGRGVMPSGFRVALFEAVMFNISEYLAPLAATFSDSKLGCCYLKKRMLSILKDIVSSG